MTKEEWHEIGKLQTKILFWTVVLNANKETGKFRHLHPKPYKLKKMKERYELLTMGYDEEDIKEFEKQFKHDGFSKDEQRAFIKSVVNENLTLEEFVLKHTEYPNR